MLKVEKYEPEEELGRESKEFRVGHCNVTSSIGYFPDKKTLFKMSKAKLENLWIKRIMFDTITGITNLTFVFSNGVTSPPYGTYDNEPTKEVNLPSGKDRAIRRVNFGLEKYGSVG